MEKVINNFVIDHVLRGIMVDKAGDYMWSINQITNPSLSVSLSDTSQAVDALGTPIAEFDRGRSAEFSAENSLFDLGLYAAQMGNKKEDASEKETKAPTFEEIEIQGTENETYVLKHIPVNEVEVPTPINSIYLLNEDETLGEIYKYGTQASNKEFAFAFDSESDPTSATITLPTGLKKGDRLLVVYDYMMKSGVTVTADAINFPKRGKFIMEVLGADVCDQESLVHAYVVFHKAKLDGNVDYSFTTDGTHPFTIKAMQDYCAKEKKLFTIVVPDEE